MIIVDTLMADNRPTGIGIYTINLVKHLSKYMEFEVLTHSPELFGGNLGFIRCPKALAPTNGKKAAILRTLFLQTLIGKGILYRTYHGISLFWSGVQIITIHDILPILFPKRYPEQNYLYRYFIKPFIGRVEYIITVSKRSKRDIVEYFKFPEERVKVFYQGYDENVFKPINDSEAVLKIKQRYGVFDYILVVGAQYLHKNVEILIRALPKLKSLQLIITGTREPYENMLGEEIVKNGVEDRVKIFKYVPQKDLVYLYAGAKVVAMPTRYEGFGIPVLEAMAMGIPVVGTEAVREVGGDAIEYAHPDDVDSWVEAINKVMDNRSVYVNRGFERVRMFSWDKTAREIAVFLKSFFPP